LEARLFEDGLTATLMVPNLELQTTSGVLSSVVRVHEKIISTTSEATYPDPIASLFQGTLCDLLTGRVSEVKLLVNLVRVCG
jgi:hypothetical protein